MALVTLQVVEGLERGKVYSSLETPFTIGREISNPVALNDESISRYHTKVQDDNGKVILTDLGSTNGTRVNGHPVQLRVLQPGDLIFIGRCILMFGTPSEVGESFLLMGEEKSEDLLGTTTREPINLDLPAKDQQRTAEESDDDDDGSDIQAPDFRVDLFPQGCPELPAELSLIQRAQVSDLLAFAHHRIVQLLAQGVEDIDGAEKEIRLSWEAWQNIIQTELELARALQTIAEPE